MENKKITVIVFQNCVIKQISKHVYKKIRHNGLSLLVTHPIYSANLCFFNRHNLTLVTFTENVFP